MNKSTRSEIDFDKGKTWENDVIHHIKKQRNIAYFGVVTLLILCLCLGLAIAVMSPLKRVEPVFYEVEKSTGQITMKTNLIEGIVDVTEKNAIIEAMLAKYLISWKTYEFTDNLERQDFIKAMSTPDVYRNQYLAMWTSNDENVNPKIKYGTNGKAEVEILSIAQLNENTHQARIAVNEKRANRTVPQTQYFVVILRHKIATGNMIQKDRWINPIGILIDSIRFDDEYID